VLRKRALRNLPSIGWVRKSRKPPFLRSLEPTDFPQSTPGRAGCGSLFGTLVVQRKFSLEEFQTATALLRRKTSAADLR